jgi:hypothetical protein
MKRFKSIPFDCSPPLSDFSLKYVHLVIICLFKSHAIITYEMKYAKFVLLLSQVQTVFIGSKSV